MLRSPYDEHHFPHPSDTNSEVWSSADGAEWVLETAQAPWPGRHCAGWLVHDGKLFVVGGDANPPVGYDTDVWSSPNGRDWTLVNARVPWSRRAGHLTASFDGYLWVLGGQTKGDPDTTVGFAAARDSEMVAGQPQAEILAPDDGPQAGTEEAYNEVWRSRDGADWECVSEAAPWSPRAWVGGQAVLNGRLYVIGGGFIGGYDEETGTVGYIQDTLVYAEPKPTRPSYNDVWSTADGVEWVCHTEHAAFRRRHYHEVAAFDSKLWVLEGYNGHPLRYPEEPPDAELLPVGAEGNRNGRRWYFLDLSRLRVPSR